MCIDGKKLLERILKRNIVEGYGLNSCGLGQGLLVGSCEHGD
jgi:hypothetical protein